MRVLILPNVQLFVETVVRGEMEKGGQAAIEAEACLGAAVTVLRLLEEDVPAGAGELNGVGGEEERERLRERVGELVAEEVWKLGRGKLVRAILEPQGGVGA